MVWTMGLKAPSPSLLMTPSWVLRWTRQKGEPSYRDLDRLEEWANMNCMKITKTSAKSCTWDNKTKEPSTGYDLCGWRATLLRRAWGSWWPTS